MGFGSDAAHPRHPYRPLWRATRGAAFDPDLHNSACPPLLFARQHLRVLRRLDRHHDLRAGAMERLLQQGHGGVVRPPARSRRGNRFRWTRRRCGAGSGDQPVSGKPCWLASCLCRTGGDHARRHVAVQSAFASRQARRHGPPARRRHRAPRRDASAYDVRSGTGFRRSCQAAGLLDHRFCLLPARHHEHRHCHASGADADRTQGCRLRRRPLLPPPSESV